MGMILKIIGFVVVVIYLFKFAKRKIFAVLQEGEQSPQISNRRHDHVIEICPNCGIELLKGHRCKRT